MNPSLPLSKRLATAIRAAFFYAPWYLRQWLPGGAPSGGEPWARRHLRFVARSSRRLARSLFHAMLRYGPGLEKRQMLLGRFVDFGAELYAQVATVVRAEALIARGERREDVLPLVEDFCAGSRIRIGELRRGLGRNQDTQTYALAQGFLKGDFPTLLAGRVPNPFDPPAGVGAPVEERPAGTPVGV